MKESITRLLLVDDSVIFREGLAALISLEEDIEVVGEASSGEEAILLTESLNPDLILMDVRISSCNGAEITKEFYQRFPWIRIMVLAIFDEDEYIFQSFQNGALKYVLKGTPSKQIAAAIRSLDKERF
jgi:DNA-binding NarL/FixJ family response regulator